MLDVPRRRALLDRVRTPPPADLRGPQLVLIGGSLVVIAAFGPWVTVADAVTRHTINGNNAGRHGIGCMVMAVIALVLILPTLGRRGQRVLPLPVIALGAVIVAYGFSDSGSVRHHEQVYTEWGLWLTILGGLSLVAGGVLTLLRR